MPDNADPEPADHRLVLGVVVSPRVSPAVRDALVDLPVLLAEHIPSARWAVDVVEEQLVVPPADALDLLEAARDRLLDAEWDLAVVLTDLPLTQGRRVALTQASPVHGIGLVSVPALGAVRVREKTRSVLVRLIGDLLGPDTRSRDNQAEVTRTRRSTGRNATADDGLVSTGRVLGGNLRLLLGMVRANRPWRLAIGLSRALTVAAATGVLVLVTSDLWLLSASYGPLRLSALGAMAVGAVSLTLIIGAGLWERPRRPREREQVMLFNAATAITVVIGVLVFYLALFGLSVLGALLLVHPEVYAGAVGRTFEAAEVGRLAWLTATLATVGGALGAGLETDDAVREAAYTRRTEVVEDDPTQQV